MKYQELILLLPCHSLEDFPTHHDGDDAEGLLAAWTALWHPALLAAAGQGPTWYRADDPPQELADRLVVIPSVSYSQLPTGFAQRAKAAGACVVRRPTSRAQLLNEALAELDGGAQGVPDDLVTDFVALGYCHLQVELLTRQMRYSSSLDEIHFRNELIAGAAAAVAGRIDEAHDKLAACFDLLAEERDRYYSVDAFLLDLVLVAEATLGPRLQAELQQATPVNFLLPAEALRRMASDEPQTLALLRAALDAGRAGLVGGEAVEQRLPLLAPESVLANLRRGLAVYESLLGLRPRVFGRRRFGLVPLLPQLLTRLGFQGALHATLDEGRFPEGGQVKIRWEGSGSAVIDSVGRTPRNASQAATFLGYAGRLGESMDMDHVATVFLAHWPGQARPWLGDLRRVATFTSALGRPVTVEQYFKDTDLAGHADRFEADQYRSPYLQQSVIRREDDPISTCIRYWRRRVQADSLQALDTLVRLLQGEPLPGLVELSAEVDAASEVADVPELDERLAGASDEAARRLAERLPRDNAQARPGYLICNPLGFVRRVAFEAPGLSGPPEVERPVYAAGTTDQRTHVVVDVPSMGFAWIQAADPAARPGRKEALPLADEGLLRNEFFEALINPQTGALQSILEYQTRGNRLSAQLAFRTPRPDAQRRDESAVYSVMAAERVAVTASSSVYGEIVSEGQLRLPGGEPVAGFRQRFQIWRGSRVLRIEIELDPLQEPKADPWNSYFACRFAWAEEAAEVTRAINQTRQPVESKRFEAPNYIEIEDTRGRTAILTGGLPYHRRHGLRMLDSLLIVRGERQRRFEMGIGIDLPQPMHEALALLAPAALVAQTASPPRPQPSGWLFHIDARGVLATHWEPLLDQQRTVGVRVRLLETAGRAARCRLRCLRPVESAEQRDFEGKSLGNLRVGGDAVHLEFAAHEWLEVEARWRP